MDDYDYCAAAEMQLAAYLDILSQIGDEHHVSKFAHNLKMYICDKITEIEEELLELKSYRTGA